MAGPHTANSAEELDIDQIGSVSTEIELPTLGLTQKLLNVWEEELGLDGELPHKSAFTPIGLGDLMPYVYILEKVGDGGDFRVRFMGSAIVRSVGDDYTGAVIGENSNHPSAWRADIYRLVMARKEPVFTAVSLGDFEREFTKTECVLLPVAGNDGNVEWIVCAAAPYPREH
ncbi:MAG: PAS domain-containing protein [Kordiimonadaceae bacterium]|nr:PAS domain-containing protein [Kordiimonadaceae bacterium]MBO6570501.1 PAS domain-containing protein [Kordiimonadaceae bacterium]MBO6966380.1 PAS domain-containing protein [Kordiimonadaceae bacterium]